MTDDEARGFQSLAEFMAKWIQFASLFTAIFTGIHGTGVKGYT